MFIDIDGDPTLAGAQELKDIADAESSPPYNPPPHIASLESGLTELHSQDDSDAPPFSIRPSVAFQNGKGSFASRDIQRGDLILSEKPIFFLPTTAPEPLRRLSIEATVRNMSPAHLDSYLSLKNSHDKCTSSSDPLLGIFDTNSFTISEDNSGICLGGSRFNHSCSPNACFDFDSDTGELRIHALTAISHGEEIFISYISRRCLYGSPRRSRQSILHNGYHFTCVCSLCSLPEAESKISDVRRHRLNELWEIAGRLTPTQEDQCFNVIVEGIRLLREEGYLADVDDFLNEAGPIEAIYSGRVGSLPVVQQAEAASRIYESYRSIAREVQKLAVHI